VLPPTQNYFTLQLLYFRVKIFRYILSRRLRRLQNQSGSLKRQKRRFALAENLSRIVKPNLVSTHTTLLKTHTKILIKRNCLSVPFNQSVQFIISHYWMYFTNANLRRKCTNWAHISDPTLTLSDTPLLPICSMLKKYLGDISKLCFFIGNPLLTLKLKSCLAYTEKYPSI